MGDVLKKVPVREQAPKVRATNFDEVCLGYNKEEAMEEASRCLTCKNAKCVQGCPVNINIPAFIKEVKEGNFAEAYKVIGQSSALPAVCGRVCPQETQCEGKCIRGIKGEAVSIGKLERFVADWAKENGIKPEAPAEKNGHKVAVIGSGPSGLTCAGDLAKLGYDVTIFEALHQAGGVLVYGIPEFRLPKDKVVKAEVENVKSLGVKINTNVIIGKSTTVDELMEKEGFEAVFIGSGAGLPMFMGIPGNLQTVCKVIRTSRRDIPKRYRRTDFHQTGYHFVQRSVSTAAHDQINLFCHDLCHLFRILRSLGRMNYHFITAFDKNINDIHQLITNLPFSGSRIEDKQHSSFHSTPHLFILSYSFPIINLSLLSHSFSTDIPLSVRLGSLYHAFCLL